MRTWMTMAAAAAAACSLNATAQNISQGEVARTTGQPNFADEPFGGRRNVNELADRRGWSADPDWNAGRRAHVPDRWSAGRRDSPYRMQHDYYADGRNADDSSAARRIPAAPGNPQHLRNESRMWPDDAYAQYERAGPRQWRDRDRYQYQYRDRDYRNRSADERGYEERAWRGQQGYPRDPYFGRNARYGQRSDGYSDYAERGNEYPMQAQRLRGRSMYDIHPEQGLSDNRRMMQHDRMMQRQRMMDRDAMGMRER